MKQLHAYSRRFAKPVDLRRRVLIKMATAAFDARNRLAELSAAQHLENQLSDLEQYYEDLYISGHSTR